MDDYNDSERFDLILSQGDKSFYDNEPLDDNPYRKDTCEHNAWNEGFYRAFEEWRAI